LFSDGTLEGFKFIDMIDNELLEAITESVREVVRHDREKTVTETLERFGLNIKSLDDEISMNKASKILKRRFVENELEKKIRCRYVKNEAGKTIHVWLNRDDVMREKNKRKI